MRSWRLLIISIFIIAILTTSSLAAIKTVTYTSELFTGTTPLGKLVNWNDDHTLPYFNPQLGRLISVDFTATLNASLNALAENLAEESVSSAYIAVATDMYVVMINGEHLPLNVGLRVPKTGDTSVSAFDGTMDLAGPDSFGGLDAADTWGSINYSL